MICACIHRFYSVSFVRSFVWTPKSNSFSVGCCLFLSLYLNTFVCALFVFILFNIFCLSFVPIFRVVVDVVHLPRHRFVNPLAVWVMSVHWALQDGWSTFLLYFSFHFCIALNLYNVLLNFCKDFIFRRWGIFDSTFIYPTIECVIVLD